MSKEPSLYTIYVPLRGNDGVPFSEDQVDAVLKRIAEISGGYTALPASHGFWVDADGKSWSDTVMPVQVVASGSKAFQEVIICAEWIAQRLDQIEVFFHQLMCTLRPHAQRDDEPPIAIAG